MLNKFFIVAIAAIALLCPQLKAQKVTTKTPAARNFKELNDTRIRNFVTLPYGKMVIDLQHPSDYGQLIKLDTLLTELQRDIAFYKDSLTQVQPAAVRIDYAVLPDNSRQLRFKVHPQEGDLYVINNGGPAHLKTGTDTVKLWIVLGDTQHKVRINNAQLNMKQDEGNDQSDPKLQTRRHEIAVTLYLDNYGDIRKAIAGNTAIQQALDSLHKGLPKQAYSHLLINSSNAYSATFNMNTGSYQSTNSLVATQNQIGNRRDMLVVNFGGGIGTVRNVLAPTSEIAIGVYKHYRNSPYSSTQATRMVFQSVFFFEQNTQGNYLVHSNWFFNIESQRITKSSTSNYPDINYGAGFLFRQSGNYFKRSTFKIYASIVNEKLNIFYTPELIFTNNFRQIFPGFSVSIRL